MKCFEGVDKVYRVSARGNDVKGVMSSNSNMFTVQLY